MNNQELNWDREYKNSKFLTKENQPQSDVVRFVKYLKKEIKLDFDGINVLDLGSGTGRNSFYFAELGANVSGIEISKNAIDIAKRYLEGTDLKIDYIKGSMGDEKNYSKFPQNFFDIALDITSSNSLNEEEREIYLKELNRVMKNGGVFMLKALCKDGDENAKNLIKKFPGKEKDTYVLPDVGIVERVWTKESLLEMYQKYFKVLEIEKKTTYTKMNNRPYKRNFWIVYMVK